MLTSKDALSVQRSSIDLVQIVEATVFEVLCFVVQDNLVEFLKHFSVIHDLLQSILIAK